MEKKTNWRWWICGLLFAATTINYLDRQVLSLTAKEFIYPEFNWTDADYGIITGFFTIFYSFCSLGAGRVIDWLGTRKGYVTAIAVWSTGAVLHAFCGWAVALGISALVAFLFCRAILALGESGNFPSAVKVTAEYFPKKDRALATSVFNAGASVGALAAPMLIPALALAWGWEMSFVIIGALGFIWLFFWLGMYRKPEKSTHVSKEELAYINQDDVLTLQPIPEDQVRVKPIGFLKCLTYRQTWAFISGKFFTDGVWWFMLFWTPNYLQDQFDCKASSPLGMKLLFVIYLICTVGSIFGGYLPKYFVEHRAMHPYTGRMRAMLIFAFFPIVALFAQPLGIYSPWWPALLIGLTLAGHQSWSSNLYCTIGDMFPKSTIATITGIGTMAGGVSSGLLNHCSGILFDYASGQGTAFAFAGFTGKPAAYMIIFCLCAVAYLCAWTVMKILVPKYRKIV